MLPALPPVLVYFCSPHTINTKEAPVELKDDIVGNKLQLAAKTTKRGDTNTSNPKTSSVHGGQGSSHGSLQPGWGRGMRIQKNVQNLKGRMQDAFIKGTSECKVRRVLDTCWIPHTSQEPLVGVGRGPGLRHWALQTERI